MRQSLQIRKEYQISDLAKNKKKKNEEKKTHTHNEIKTKKKKREKDDLGNNDTEIKIVDCLTFILRFDEKYKHKKRDKMFTDIYIYGENDPLVRICNAVKIYGQ